MTRFINNPLIMMNPKYAAKEIFTVDKRFFENTRIIRGYIRDIIEDRQAKADSGANDLVSLILQDPSY